MRYIPAAPIILKYMQINSKKDVLLFCCFLLQSYFCAGELAEWSIAAVLKTVDCNRSGGSNPSLSANLTSVK